MPDMFATWTAASEATRIGAVRALEQPGVHGVLADLDVILMRMITGRNHPHFNLDGGMPQGIKTVVRAAKDPVTVRPQDEAINVLLQRTLCRAKLELDCWEVTSVTGIVK